LRIPLIRKGGGKIVTVVRGYKGNKEGLKSLGKYLLSSCRTGGTFKQNEISLQGDFREKVKILLMKKGYKSKFSGG
jgi:Translation initiation factor 1 (eIF-1/SUI1) and related proteins